MNDTCEVDTARFGRPMRPSTMVGATVVGALGLIGADRAPACGVAEPWLTSLRGLASYTVPKVDVMVSAIFRSQPNAQPQTIVGLITVATNGDSRKANYQTTSAQFQAITGTPLRPGLAIDTFDLLKPGDLYGDRVNVVDMRFTKVLRFGRTRTNVGLDLYNTFNVNTPSVLEQVYDPSTNGARWMRPTMVVLPRFVRVNVQLDF